MITDWKSTRTDDNLDVFLPILFQQVHVTDNPHTVLYLVRNVFHKPCGVLNPDNLLGIIDTDVYAPALCIGKAAYPSEIFVSPALLKLYVLRLFHSVTIEYIAQFLDLWNFSVSSSRAF